MDKIYYLKTCSTCIRILKEINPGEGFELREIKSNPVTAMELDKLASLAGSYEALFSRKSRKYLALSLHEKTLAEGDYRQLILDEYTFLKRPLFQIGNQVFAGNSKEVLKAAKAAIIAKWEI